ncbi:MAG: HAMP domain-containing sensor histidine kinase [Clostridium sp.]|uniref:HAMP domain-containing sensor histidine kinase n=1 Tax=Clostridium sp. TaxID=1506 RepID=UPI003D6CDC8B
MSGNFKKSLNICLILALVIFILSSSLSIIFTKDIDKNSKNSFVLNEQRTSTSSIVNYIENNYGDLLQNREQVIPTVLSKVKEIEGNLQIIDLEGKVLFDSKNIESSKNNIYIDIKSNISYDKSFTQQQPGKIKFTIPLVIKGKQIGNSIFVVNSKGNFTLSERLSVFYGLIPVIIGFIFIVFIVIFLYYKITTDFIRPLKDLKDATDSIAIGNYDKKIKYRNNTELGLFCNNFEFMRDELKTALNKAQELERSRKELIACVSHDLRTPIASIKAYVDGLKSGIAVDAEKRNKYISVIAKKTDSLIDLINDLFQHSQAELGELKMVFDESYSGEFLSKTVQPMVLEAQKKSIVLYIKEPISNVIISVDKIRIEQVIMNLIQNAIKYTPEGGNIYFSTEIEDKYLKIIVKDSGFGISQRDLPFIFEKFYRGEKSRSRDFGGAGLGLSICKYIVEKHGGIINVVSIEDEGSEFSFTIPI